MCTNRVFTLTNVFYTLKTVSYRLEFRGKVSCWKTILDCSTEYVLVRANVKPKMAVMSGKVNWGLQVPVLKYMCVE